MSRSRPERVRVLGKKFAILYVSGVPLEEDELGECDTNKQTISLRDGQPLEQEQDSILHELFHAIEDLMGLDLPHEDIVRLTTGIHAIIKDNPSLIGYLRRTK